MDSRPLTDTLDVRPHQGLDFPPACRTRSRVRGDFGSEVNEMVNSGTGRQPDGAALPSEGGLSRLRNGGTAASLLSSRHLSCPVCETKSLQQLPGIYIFNKKVNIAQQVEGTLHACRPEPATRTLKLP